MDSSNATISSRPSLSKVVTRRQNKAEAKRGSTATVVHQSHVEDVKRREVKHRSGAKVGQKTQTQE